MFTFNRSISTILTQPSYTLTVNSLTHLLTYLLTSHEIHAMPENTNKQINIQTDKQKIIQIYLIHLICILLVR